MTITLTHPVLWGLLTAIIVGYMFVGMSLENSEGMNPAVAIAIVASVQVGLFLIVYGFLTLMGM